jgi:acyl-CoA oxidase
MTCADFVQLALCCQLWKFIKLNAVAEYVFVLFLQDVLSLLRSMYALICLEEDAAFLRYGYLSTDHAAAVRKEVTKLCSEIRPHALALVSSFGIPGAFLSPIAFNWIDANSWSSVQH